MRLDQRATEATRVAEIDSLNTELKLRKIAGWEGRFTPAQVALPVNTESNGTGAGINRPS